MLKHEPKTIASKKKLFPAVPRRIYQSEQVHQFNAVPGPLGLRDSDLIITSATQLFIWKTLIKES